MTKTIIPHAPTPAEAGGRPPQRSQGQRHGRIQSRAQGQTTARGWRSGGVCAVAACALLLTVVIAPGASAQSPPGLAVEVTNASEPERCAEKDNVTINLASSAVRRFQIEATHPSYLGSLVRDSFEADWTGCTSPDDPKPEPGPAPRRTTLYEDYDLWVVGQTYPSFWRPATATVRIGERVAKDVHLLQVWLRRPMGGEEVLVLYPQDGYWRLRPRAPAGMAPTAFGSSFLIGPVEVDGRPVVRIKEVAFDPKARAFALSFERGGAATVAMTKVDHSRHLLDVAFDAPVAGVPFATLRSMYVTEIDNDVARIAVLEAAAKGWREDGIMPFKGAHATHVWTGRQTPSRHNTSSPDVTFRGFSAAAVAPLPAR